MKRNASMWLMWTNWRWLKKKRSLCSLRHLLYLQTFHACACFGSVCVILHHRLTCRSAVWRTALKTITGSENNLVSEWVLDSHILLTGFSPQTHYCKQPLKGRSGICWAWQTLKIPFELLSWNFHTFFFLFWITFWMNIFLLYKITHFTYYLNIF